MFTFQDGSVHIGKRVTKAKMEVVVKTEKIYNYNYFHLQASFGCSINLCLILGVESCRFTDFTNEEQMKYLILLPYIPALFMSLILRLFRKNKKQTKNIQGTNWQHPESCFHDS